MYNVGGIAFKRVISFLMDWKLFLGGLLFSCGGGGVGLKFPLFVIGKVSG